MNLNSTYVLPSSTYYEEEFYGIDVLSIFVNCFGYFYMWMLGGKGPYIYAIFLIWLFVKMFIGVDGMSAVAWRLRICII